MPSQTFGFWDKQQSADNYVFQFHLTLKCTKDQSSHFSDCFLVSKWIFQHHDRGPTKFHAGPENLPVCVVINNSSYPDVKNNNTAQHAFRKYWMQARGFLNYRLKYCWPKSFLLYMSTKWTWTGNYEKNGGEGNRRPSKNLGGHGQ